MWTDCSSLLALRASCSPSPLSPHTSSPATSVFPSQTRASDRASQLGSTESLALMCRERGSQCCSGLPVSPIHRDMAAAPSPPLSSWWAGGPQPGVLPGSPCNPLAPPSAPPPCSDQWLSNRATVLYPSFCAFKFCSLVLLTSSWPTSWLPPPPLQAHFPSV